ncbi:DUF6531 domain-containing protein [Hyalangium gracile]|uniref:DUF6531 domain-containing protein n=1 Tax=Hyalangium gracile TaxID=394092 RepID=UPI001CCF21E9|nr:DUF6531 domain-containing protein [Hyalangium gracile]
MIASSWMDPVLGVDIHFEMVPTPAPVPTPIPNPFTGMVFDPLGLAAGLALGALMGSPGGPVLYWSAFPATNTGTEAKHIPGHILIPPGVAWAPFPKTPKPVIRPGEVPEPALPIKPENDAVCVFGAKTTTVMGSNAVRLGDIAMSCGEPVRLPSSVVLAVPKGGIILIGGPPSLDLMSALLASLRTRFVSDSLHALVSRMRPSRFRNLLHRVVCFFTGHPVDVASGKVMTEAVDAELPGPIPLRIERIYSSAFATRKTVLGHGWSHSLDQAVWVERGLVVLRSEDGREIEFDTFDFADHVMAPGDELWHPIDRLRLKCLGNGRWEVHAADGTVREFAPVPGRQGGSSPIQRIRAASGDAEVRFDYDKRGRLEWVRDSASRVLGLTHDEEDRLVALRLPQPVGEGWYVHTRYEYDREGDLAKVTDALGQSWSFEYVTHLMVRETNRDGLSFYFQYDGLGEDAWCVRTWGDGGIYDHRILYDKKKKVTFVTNSLGQTTQYHMNLAGQVIKVVDPVGAETAYAYDPRTLQKTKETDPLGNATLWEYDERGNCTKLTGPDGAVTERQFDEKNRPVRALDAMKGEWRWGYDLNGRLKGRVDPLNRRLQLHYEKGRLVGLTDAAGRQTTAEYDAQGNVTLVRTPEGNETRWEYDRLGRCTALIDGKGNVERREYDALGRMTRLREASGNVIDFSYDGEGHVVRHRDSEQDVVSTYQGMGRLASRTEAGTTVTFVYDTEENLTAIRNEQGEVYRFERGPTGEVVVESGFDGLRRQFERDIAGRVVKLFRPEGLFTEYAYDAAGRVVGIKHSNGGEAAYTFRPDGELIEARSDSATVTFERDVLGRVTRELAGDDWVSSEYDALGLRVRVRSSKGLDQRIHRNSAGKMVGMRAITHGELTPWETQLQRDSLGLELERKLPGGIQRRWERDRLGRPVKDELWAGRKRQASTEYTWDANNRLRMLVDSARGPIRYVHDPLGNLAAAVHGSGRIDLRMPDSVGNLFKKQDRGGNRYGPAGQLLESRAENGNVTRYEYDAEGNLVRKIETGRLERGERVWTYSWNAFGLLGKVVRPDGEAVEFEYDPLGRRLVKRFRGKTTRWIWDGNVPLHEWVEGPAAAEPSAEPAREAALDEAAARRRRGELAALPTQGPPEEVAPGSEPGTLEEPITWLFEPESFTPMARLVGDARYSILTDHLGTPTAMYDGAGREVWSASSDVYGNLETRTGERSACPFRFPGQYEDSETGLFYNRFRYYDPAIGRYVSQDPIGLAGGPAPYAYTHDPTTWADPLGLAPLDFATLMDMAQNSLDFSTARDGAVFWSGPNMPHAQAWAAANGKTTLEQTAGGRFLDSLNLFKPGSPVTPAQAAQIWDAASRRFAEGASGQVSVFSTWAKRIGDYGERTWWRIEKPALQRNPNVTGIVRRRRNGQPCAR